MEENGQKNISPVVKVIAAILILSACRIARSIFLPLLVAGFIYMLFYPFMRKLIKRGIKKGMIVFVFMVILIFFIAVLVSAIVYTLDMIVGILPHYISRVEALYEIVSGYISDHFQTKNNIDWFYGLDVKITNYVQNLAVSFVNLTKFLVLLVIYEFFMLIEHNNIRNYFVTHLKNRKIQRVVEITIRQTSKYMIVKTFVSFLTAVVTYFILLLTRMEGALIWSVLVFVFNFIPTIGSIVITCVIILFAVLQFGVLSNWGIVFIIGIFCILTQFIIGNILDPKLTGDRLHISPVVILISLALWGFVFGIPGMFMAVPLTCIFLNIYKYS